MTNSYKLINPQIKGNKFKTSIKANNSNDAAKQIYTSLSEHFNNSIPEFNFTISKNKKKLYHFQVHETRENKNNEVSFQIKKLNFVPTEQQLNQFNENVKLFNEKFIDIEGGKHKKHKKHKDSDSSSIESYLDSDSEKIYKRIKKYLPIEQPIYYWWYDPYIYNLKTVYIPTFHSFVTPYIQLSLISY
jgi:hypothetical protein